MKKHAILILSHSDISHIYEYARIFPNYNFYIHQDLKYPTAESINKDIYNISILPKEKSFSVTWAGFSMIEATNALFLYALKNIENSHFHLISGNDLIIKNIESFDIEGNKIYMQCEYSKEHRYRTRFNTPHANTNYLRTRVGKALTLALKVADKVLPSKQVSLYGSQWFSISRLHLKILLDSIDDEFNKNFKKKLCPDEHYYQHLVYKSGLQRYLSKEGNRRYIVFDKNINNGNNPLFLDLNTLINIDNNKYWFARKVKPDVIRSYIVSSK